MFTTDGEGEARGGGGGGVQYETRWSMCPGRKRQAPIPDLPKSQWLSLPARPTTSVSCGVSELPAATLRRDLQRTPRQNAALENRQAAGDEERGTVM